MAERYNLAGIQAAVRGAQAGWQAGQTSLTSLSEDERLLYLGYTPGPDEPSLAVREQAASANFEAFKSGLRLRAAAAPASFDLRDVAGSNFITPIQNQGSCGSCVSFGTIATVEGTLRFSRNDPNLAVDYSEAHLFYCHGRAQGRRCNTGWWVDPALDAFKDPGVVDDACYPYTAGDQDCTNLCSDWQNRVTKITAWHKITSIDEMKTWLSSRGPLVTCYTVYDDFFAYRSGVYKHVSGSVAGGHCVSAVGYDDAQGCWICKNSWGTGWGESGFFRIGYGEVGIDATMWAVDGFVEEEDIWHNNVQVLGLWALDQDRNAWVFLSNNLGWKRIASDNDNIFLNMLSQLAAAKASARPVNVYLQQGEIKQIYVF